MRTLLEIGLSNALAATLLAIVVAFASKLCRRPALIFCLWALVLVKFVTPPLVRIRIDPWPSGSWSTGAVRSAADRAAPSAVLADQRMWPPKWLTAAWAPALAAAWMAGSAGWVVLALARLRRFQRLVVQSPLAAAPLADEAAKLAHRLGLRRCPEVRVFFGRLPPLLWAVGRRPVVLLPDALWERLTADQRTTLLAHELSHLKRRDHWIRRLELFVLSLYWWHPVVWWARRELERAEERCCDAWVTWMLPELALTYGKALLDTIDFLAEPRPEPPRVALGFGHVRFLKQRLAAILHDRSCPRLPRRARWCVALAGLAIAPCSPWLWRSQAATNAPQRDEAAVMRLAADGRELNGRWIVRSVVQNGQPAPDEDVQKMQYFVAGDRHTFQFANLRFTGVHRIHPAERPHAIDIALTSGALTRDMLDDATSWPETAGGKPTKLAGACRGIYELQDDMLKLCVAFGPSRPDDFSAQAGSGRVLVVYRRASQ